MKFKKAIIESKYDLSFSEKSITCQILKNMDEINSIEDLEELKTLFIDGILGPSVGHGISVQKAKTYKEIANDCSTVDELKKFLYGIYHSGKNYCRSKDEDDDILIRRKITGSGKILDTSSKMRW